MAPLVHNRHLAHFVGEKSFQEVIPAEGLLDGFHPLVKLGVADPPAVLGF